jgi:uncharacterized membrane protein YcaP (DUF421 family)
MGMDTIFKAIIIYLLLWLLIRVSGRRTLAQMNAFDFILLLIIGGATQRALTSEDYSLTNALLIVMTLVSLDVGMTFMEITSPRLAKFIKGTPTILVEHGTLLSNRMRRARITEEEILEAARYEHGIERLDQIKFAVLEASGKISIIQNERKSS